MGVTIAAVVGGFWLMDFVVGRFDVARRTGDSEAPRGM